MEKRVVSMRMRIKDIDGVVLTEMNTYGLMIGNNEIRAEGRIFKAGRKAGFGKTNRIYERGNDQWREVIIDRIEQ